MDLSTITIADFKTLFFRDFSYLPVWDVTATYNTGAKVYYDINLLFYKCKNNGVTSIPTTTADWDLYTDDILNYVLDADITKAFDEAQQSINQGLFSSDADVQRGYLYLTAHFLVNDVRTAQQGISSTGEFAVSSRSVGNVSESYAIPEVYSKNPVLSFYTKSAYGIKYLNMVYPYMVGGVQTVCGGTNA